MEDGQASSSADVLQGNPKYCRKREKEDQRQKTAENHAEFKVRIPTK